MANTVTATVAPATVAPATTAPATTAPATTAPATTAPATTAPATTAPAVGDLAPLTWETKSGKTRQAHSHTGQALAPRAARLSAATSADVARLMSGRYGAFLADVRSSLTGRALYWIKADIRARLTIIVDGQALAPISEPLEGAGDKKLLLALVASLETLAEGKALHIKNGAVVDFIKCPAKCLHFATVGMAWRDALAAAEVAKKAGL